MRKSRLNDTTIVKAVYQLDSPLSANVIYREYEISRGTLDNWRSKYSDMDSIHIKHLKRRIIL